MFCAVSLAIVWGTTLERLKFVAYVIYAVVFAAIIYPLSAHWIFGGGFLSEIGGGVQDFAGSTVVHLVGATGALACLLLLGARRGKYGPDGKPRAIPGHSMPLVGLGVLILWLGWFGFNARLDARHERLAHGRGHARHAARRGGRRHRRLPGDVLQDPLARRRHGRQRRDRAASSASPPRPATWSSGRPRSSAWWPASWSSTPSWRSSRKLDDPVGALSAHGLAGIWGTLACGLFTSHPAGRAQRHRRARPVLLGLVRAARRAGASASSPRSSR